MEHTNDSSEMEINKNLLEIGSPLISQLVSYEIKSNKYEDK